MTDSKRSGEVVVVISGEDEKNAASKGGVDAPGSCPSPEIARLGSSANKPAKISTAKGLTERKSMSRSRSLHSKPKSRFGEQSLPIDPNMFDDNMFDDIPLPRLEELRETSVSPLRNTSNRSSPHNKVTSKERTPKTPLMMPSSQGVGTEDEEICKKLSLGKELKYKRVKMKVTMEWIVFLCVTGCLLASLRIEKFERSRLWGLEIWKWCVLIMVIFCGLRITNWIMRFVVLLIELNFFLRRKVLYFVHALKKSVQVFIWLTLVLLTWVLLFTNNKVKRSAIVHDLLDYTTGTIISLLIGTFLWLVKTLLLKILASSFHVNTFFDRIKESIFHQYILLTLSGPPLLGRTNTSQLSVRQRQKKGKGKQVIDINKLHEMKREKVSAWTMKMLVDVISSSGLSTISNALEEIDEGEGERKDKEITSEMEAHAAAIVIFRNIVQPNCNGIVEKALRRFMLQEEVDLVLPLIDVADKGRIDKIALIAWVVKVYKERKALAHTLNDTKTAVKQLNKLVTGVLIVVIVVVWLLLMGIATTKVLFLLSSQLVVAAFMFGNTCKNIFEAVIFVFVMHPFDVGDRCVIDGVQMIVEEMNILTTVFLKFDNEKIYYPNSVLATKPISNFYRSPEMGDSLEFSIDFMTPAEKIGTLKETIKKYLKENSRHWQPNHNVVVKEIVNVNKIKMALSFNHTINFQDFPEKSRRRSELVMEMKRIFHMLEIKYNLLPQDVNLVKQETTPTGSNT